MQRKPDWLKVKLPKGENYCKVMSKLNKGGLHSVCEEAKCPNIGECFSYGTATFLILGDRCTRNCLYCNVSSGKPCLVDYNEPKELAKCVKELGLKYVVITSVTRDDMEDGGAEIFSECVKEIKKNCPDTKVELLIPDLKGDIDSLKIIVDSKPDVLGHNIEVVENIFDSLRPGGNYGVSLELLKNVKQINPKQKTKSGLMLGLGENKKEIIKTMKDLIKSDVDFFTIGQYLQPRKDLAEVKKFYTPKEFDELRKIGLELGFKHVESGPLVRSSYRADKLNQKL